MKNRRKILTFHKKFNIASIPNWLLINLGLLTILGLVIAGILFYTTQSAIIRNRKIDDLKAISSLKTQQIVKWRKESLGDANFYASSTYPSEIIVAWLHNLKSESLEQQLIEYFQRIKEYKGYQNVLITSLDGNLLFSLDSKQDSINTETQQLALQVLLKRRPLFGDFAHNLSTGKVELNIAAPLFDSNGNSIAVLVLQTDPADYLYPLIQSWPVSSKSTETLLVRRSGDSVQYLNTLRFNSSIPLTINIPLTQLEVPAVQGVLGKTGTLEGVDYRGVHVLSVITPILGSDWIMIAKVDHDEVFSEISVLGSSVTIFVALSALLAIIFGIYAFNLRQLRLNQNMLKLEIEKRNALEETHTALYSIGDGVITTDQNGLITRLNPVAEKLTGWQEDEARGLPIARVFNIHNEKTLELTENPVDRVIREGKVVGLANHTVLVARDGSETPIADSGSPIRTEGETSGVVLVFRDQTAERSFLKEQALLNYTIEKSLNEVYLFDAKTFLFRFVNTGAIKNIGYTLDQLKTMTPLSLKPEFTLDTFNKLVTPLLEGKVPVLTFETVHKRADGTLYPIEAHLQLLDHEGDKVYLAVIVDITERKQAVQKNKENEERLLRAQEIAVVGDWEIDLKDMTVRASVEAFRIYGVERISPNVPLEKIQGMVVKEDRPRMDAALQALIQKQEKYDVEYSVIRDNDKSIRKIHSIANLGFDLHDNPSKVIGIIQDITELKQTELERRVLFEIMQGLGSSADLQHFLQLIHKSISKIIDARNISIVFYNKETTLFEEVYCVDEYDDSMPASKLEGSITAYVFKTGEPILVHQAEFTEFTKHGEMELVGTDSAAWLGAPLKKGNEVIGVISVQNYTDEHCYSDHDKEFLASVSTQVAAAIDHKRAEEALMDSEKKFRSLFGSMQEGLALHELVYSPSGQPINYRLIDVNPSYERILGISRIDSVNRLSTEVYGVAEPPYLDKYKKVVETGQSETFETFFQPIEKYFRIVAVSPGPGLFATVFDDITERKNSEEKLTDQLEELKRWHTATLGRELRILELKKEVNELLVQFGKTPRYNSAEEN